LEELLIWISVNAHIDADPDQELQDMTLHAGDDLSTFAHKFVKVHNASSVPHHVVAMLRV